MISATIGCLELGGNVPIAVFQLSMDFLERLQAQLHLPVRTPQRFKNLGLFVQFLHIRFPTKYQTTVVLGFP